MLAIAFLSPLYAQNNSHPEISKLRLETRFDYDYQAFQDTTKAMGGFSGKYLNFILAGTITDKFSYSYRQRILPNKGIGSFFDGTDWIYLTYDFTQNFSVSAGKQVFLIGGFEYDKAPIDVYFWSDFWNNIVCYQMGASLTYTDHSKKNAITFQFANSNHVERPFDNLYAYNVIWYGDYERWKTIYSVNMVEYKKGSYINYIALGNKFCFDGFHFYVDFMNRAVGEQKHFLGSDYTLIGKFEWNVSKKWNVFAKGGYDVNKAQESIVGTTGSGISIYLDPTDYWDIFVTPGTEYYYYGLGVEYFPLKENQDIRLHTFFAVKNNGNNMYHFNIGLTWRVNFLKYIQKAFM